MLDYKRLSEKLRAHRTPPDAESKVAPPKGATCQECAMGSAAYVPCGRPAEYMIENRGERYPMCPMCADHNVCNRGASYMRKTNATAPLIPDVLPGHWETDEGSGMAKVYAGKQRAELFGGAQSDMSVAFAIAMVCRSDENFEAVLASARDRIRWLSVQLALANASKDALLEQLTFALPYVETALQDRGYKIEAVTIRTKAIRDAIAKAVGGK